MQLAWTTSNASPNPGNISKLKELFPGAPEDALTPTYGDIDLLIGLDNRRLHSKGGIDVGNFRLLESIFGCGTILTGSTNGADAREWTSSIAFNMTHARPRSSLLSEEEQNNIPHFFKVEDLGFASPRLCNDCKMCPPCRL